MINIRQASAATFGLSASGESFSVGDNLTVDLDIDSQGVSVNAGQGTIRFSPDILEAESVDRSQTIFNFWLEDPEINNNLGSISFTGGSTSGFSGVSLEVFKINFRVKGVGASSIVVSDGAVTASDGSGTNVLVGTRGIDITVAAGQTLPSGQISVLPPIEQITRPATPAASLPDMPEVLVDLYPDPMVWHNASSPFLGRWALPEDITDVATLVNKNPSSNPTVSEGLFDNKTFAALDDGIWYLHVRFRNNVGWGPTDHYRIAVDTVPPSPFGILSSSGTSSTNPSPTISFFASDALSGIAGYSVQIDNGDYDSVSGSSFTFPPLVPGVHDIRVAARDSAGNSTETFSELEIIPIESPTIDYLTPRVYIGEGGLEAGGSSLPGYSVVVSLKNIEEAEIASTVVLTDESGNWFVQFNDPLRRGRYYIEATAKDSRGALSLPVSSEEIRASSKPIIVVGGIGITPEVLAFLFVLFVIGGFVAGRIAERKLSRRRRGRTIIATRDMMNVFNLVKKDVDAATNAVDKSKTASPPEVKYHLEKIKKDIDKMAKYLVQGVEEIGK